MSSILTIKLAVDNLYWRMRYDDCNPEIGMGSSVESMYDDMTRDLKLHFSDKDKSRIIAVVQRQIDRYRSTGSYE